MEPPARVPPVVLSEREFWERYGTDESNIVEFKERLTKASKSQDTIVAFANSRGGALLLGISESKPRALVGHPYGQEVQERVQELARATHPPHDISVTCLMVAGKTVPLLDVRPVERGWVQTSDGRLLVRAGPTNRALVGQELQRFVQERGTDPAEERVVKDMVLEDLDMKALRRFIDKRMPARPRGDVAMAAKKLGLLDQQGRVRLVALLLFGRAPKRWQGRFGIDVLRFEGTIAGKSVYRDKRTLGGTLPQLVDEADRVIYEEMRRDAVVRGLVREEVPEYPALALREALVNAVGHRDYSLRGSAVEVRLYDDGIEIQSPGGLAGWVTLDNLRDAQYSRNEKIMDGLQLLGLVEEAGTGIDRMYEEMEGALLDPPEFDEGHGSFRVRFRGRSVFAAEDRLWVARFADLDLVPHAKVALVYARRHAAVTNGDLQALRGISSREARQLLQDLVARKLLTPAGRGRGTHYMLGELALRARSRPDADEQVQAIVSYAKRAGPIANSDVRGLLGLTAPQARELLEIAVAQRLLRPEGERRGRRYIATTAG